MQLERLKNFFINDCLPVWAMTSYDRQNGQFMDALRLDGSAETTGIVCTRNAVRQIYVFTHAAALGVAPAGALEKAEMAFANLHRVAWDGGGRPGYVRSFNRVTNQVIDAERDLYDNACVLLALAWLYKVTGKSEYLTHISGTIDAVDITLADPFGGWAEDSAGTLPRQQNPHMHYLEACLSLFETDDRPHYLELADRLFTLFRERFLGGLQGPLREYFGPHWEVSDRFGSDRVSPGHMCEWVWLVQRYSKITNSKHHELCDNLLTTALSMGRSEPSPLLFDEVRLDGSPPEPSHRLWPQAELLKAFLIQFREQGNSVDLQNAETVAQSLFGFYFANAPVGCWHDRLDAQGQSIAKTIPASSLYHLWTAVVELLDDPAELFTLPAC